MKTFTKYLRTAIMPYNIHTFRQLDFLATKSLSELLFVMVLLYNEEFYEVVNASEMLPSEYHYFVMK